MAVDAAAPLDGPLVIHDMFGPSARRQVRWDDIPQCEEEQFYNYKELASSLQFDETLPNTAPAFESYLLSQAAKLGAFTPDTSDTLFRWVMAAADTSLECPNTAFMRAHRDSRGLARLDKYIGYQLMKNDKNFKNQEIGAKLRTYQQWCLLNQQTPTGRAIWTLCAYRYQADRYTTDLATVEALFSLKPTGNSNQQIREFVQLSLIHI